VTGASDALASQLAGAGFALSTEQIGDQTATIARAARFAWRWLGRMHFFVVVFHQAPASADDVSRLSASAMDFAIHHKGGLPRGVQTGTIAFPVFLTEDPADELVERAEAQPVGRWAAMALPVLADLSAQRLHWFRGRLAKGSYFEPDMHDLVSQQLARGLGCAP
jgi:hypothetical protein